MEPIMEGIIHTMNATEEAGGLAIDTYDMAQANGDRAVMLALAGVIYRPEEAHKFLAQLAGEEPMWEKTTR